ncbi:MAG: DUF2117 domain-containing protein [Methanocalculus sp. MSAO_Arc2]|uniref:DUF2117 domain-containing protein n=1 Tax=Methanocalculus sp. MSAO_Arc2 TaxID=2293855 RepID=UPI000FF45F7C|nr:MAG: DUF2117 domain-containing protein [Methanocalculus sp. MSAO_Arc2]
MHAKLLTCILHGPDVFDEGDAVFICEALIPDNIIVAGVMGRTAARESGLPVSYASSPPSIIINQIRGDCILVNRGKTPISGRRFGEIVASRIHGGRGLIHIECSDQICYLWNGGDRDLAIMVSERLGYPMVEAWSAIDRGSEMRRICGCIPGEPVFIEGIVIGYATSDCVVISRNNSTIIPVSGIRLKPHGVLKLSALGDLPLDQAWCKSGQIRSSLPRSPERLAPQIGRIAVIDHSAFAIYQVVTPDTCGMVTIGDDTTAVCGHIGAASGVPVFGITDGDADEIVPEAYAPGSVIVQTISETDDELGREVASVLPDRGDLSWDETVSSLLDRFFGRIRMVRDLR